jgi:hypothetical protein
MLTNDLSSVRRILKDAVNEECRHEALAIDADALIGSLGAFYPNGIPFDREVLRAEVARLAAERGRAVEARAYPPATTATPGAPAPAPAMATPTWWTSEDLTGAR